MMLLLKNNRHICKANRKPCLDAWTLEKLKNIQMKKSFLLAIILSCCSFVFGQNELLVHSSGKNMYLTHTVASKENFYSIGRLYNVSPKDIAAFNALDMNKGLSVGQNLKIPLNA